MYPLDLKLVVGVVSAPRGIEDLTPISSGLPLGPENDTRAIFCFGRQCGGGME